MLYGTADEIKTKYYSVDKNVFSRFTLFRDNIYNVN